MTVRRQGLRQILYKRKGYPLSSSDTGTTGWISSLSVTPEAGKDYPPQLERISGLVRQRGGVPDLSGECAGREDSSARAVPWCSPPIRSSRLRLMCRSCGHQSTVTAGTIFDKTRIAVAACVAGRGVVPDQPEARRRSALGLQRVLWAGELPETAWTMLHPVSPGHGAPRSGPRLKGAGQSSTRPTRLAIHRSREELPSPRVEGARTGRPRC